MAENFRLTDPNYPTPLRNYLVAALDEWDNTLSLDDALGAVQAWLEDQAEYQHPMFSSGQSTRRATINWLLSDEFSDTAVADQA